MTQSWITCFRRLLGITGASTAIASVWTPALAALPDAATTNVAPLSKLPLILERPNFNEGQRYAGHSSHASHASHASHSSHYSGSGGGGGSDYDPYVPYPTYPTTPASSAAVPVTPPVSRATDNLVMVMRVQSKLHDLGYYGGPINGTLGPMTKDALRRYQLVQGLPVTSAMDDATLAALGITY